MFVVTSWVSFLIKPEVVPGRMALLVTLFLVLINIFNSVREQAPISSRLNAVDLYLVVCVFFVFGKYLIQLKIHKSSKMTVIFRRPDGVCGHLTAIKEEATSSEVSG